MVKYAKRELARIGRDEEGLQDLIDKNILDIVEMFSEQGHSGFSAGYALSVLERLLRYKPLTPLTGEPDEWNDTGHGSKQNKRCFSVFLDGDKAHDNDAIIVSDNGGITWFTSGRFRKEVTFPYTTPIPKKSTSNTPKMFLPASLVTNLKSSPTARSVSMPCMTESGRNLTRGWAKHGRHLS